VFPHAPKRSVSLNGGFAMPAWFDVGANDLTRGESCDLPGLRKADAQIQTLIEREVARGIPANKIVLGGFSQGGALATYSALRYSQPLAGLIALSTFLPRNVPLEAETTAANRVLPVFGAHGTRDNVVSLAHGQKLRDRLVANGCEVEWHEYPMVHEVCLEEIAHWGAWIRAHLA